MHSAEALCRKYGTLFVLDEVQTGMYRTGPFLAAHMFDVEPDMVILAKALSGGLIPVGALLMSDAVYGAVFDSLRNSIIHASTFSDNSISMRAGLATLAVLERESLGERATGRGRRCAANYAPRSQGLRWWMRFAGPASSVASLSARRAN